MSIPANLTADLQSLQDHLQELFPVEPPAPMPRPGHYVTEDPPYSVTCWATMFGLNWNGSVDAGDNGVGNFIDHATGQPYNTRNHTLTGVSLPREIMMSTFLGFDGWKGENITEIWKSHEKAVQAFIENNSPSVYVDCLGHTLQNAPIVDSGPKASTGNGLDLTFLSAHILDTHGRALVTYKIMIADKAVEIKGWNWSTRRING